jgi:hypothetical protein
LELLEAKLINKRKASFDAYREDIQKKRLEHLRHALSILGSASYTTITALAHDTSKLIYELEQKHAQMEAEKQKSCDKKEIIVEKICYTTLLRNKKYYRPVLDAHFFDEEKGKKKETVEISDHEALKIHCANLDNQNEILRLRLEHFKPSDSIAIENTAKDKNESEDIKSKDIAMLIGIVTSIVSEVSDLFSTVNEDEVDADHPSPGLYGPMSLVDYNTLKRFEELRYEYNTDK